MKMKTNNSDIEFLKTAYLFLGGVYGVMIGAMIVMLLQTILDTCK